MDEVQNSQSSQDLQLVIFRLANEEYGLPITKVQEINRLVPITKLPQTPSFMEGIIRLRERIIPVIDLRKRFSLATAPHDDETRIIMVEINKETVGFVVDSVMEVVWLDNSKVEPPPQSFVLDAQYVQGVGKMEDRLIILLDIDQVLTSKEEIALKQVAG